MAKCASEYIDKLSMDNEEDTKKWQDKGVKKIGTEKPKEEKPGEKGIQKKEAGE